MRHLMRTMAVLGVVLGAASMAAVTTAQAQTAGRIAGSPHDLSGLTTATDEVCVFCHTPHAAAARTDDELPLWNKVAVTTGFTTYDSAAGFSSTTLDGAILPVGSVSVACLSCHDGTQAMDSVINAPGSQGVNPAGAEIDALNIGAIGLVNAAADLGKDLTNDHPIGIQYGGFDPGTGVIDPDFKDLTNGLQTATINGTSVWWINTAADTTRDKNDIILYTRDSDVGAGVALQPFVECGSCHDPHQGTVGGVTTLGSEVNFMRVANTGSDLCLTCHVK